MFMLSFVLAFYLYDPAKYQSSKTDIKIFKIIDWLYFLFMTLEEFLILLQNCNIEAKMPPHFMDFYRKIRLSISD